MELLSGPFNYIDTRILCAKNKFVQSDEGLENLEEIYSPNLIHLAQQPSIKSPLNLFKRDDYHLEEGKLK